uniref:hypothetical protein n=1 Tax=Methylogaea oryzae TaxID=1295382 RepID=UPI00357132A8
MDYSNDEDATRTHRYDAPGHLTDDRKHRFTYNGLGQRIAKTVNAIPPASSTTPKANSWANTTTAASPSRKPSTWAAPRWPSPRKAMKTAKGQPSTPSTPTTWAPPPPRPAGSGQPNRLDLAQRRLERRRQRHRPRQDHLQPPPARTVLRQENRVALQLL